jgi:hypothetical protein
MKITADLLRSKGACEEQVLLFVELGGDDLELTEELCVRHADKFDWFWAACKLLSTIPRNYYLKTQADAWDMHYAGDFAFNEFRKLQAAAFWRALQMEE